MDVALRWGTREQRLRGESRVIDPGESGTWGLLASPLSAVGASVHLDPAWVVESAVVNEHGAIELHGTAEQIIGVMENSGVPFTRDPGHVVGSVLLHLAYSLESSAAVADGDTVALPDTAAVFEEPDHLFVSVRAPEGGAITFPPDFDDVVLDFSGGATVDVVGSWDRVMSALANSSYSGSDGEVEITMGVTIWHVVEVGERLAEAPDAPAVWELSHDGGLLTVDPYGDDIAVVDSYEVHGSNHTLAEELDQSSIRWTAPTESGIYTVSSTWALGAESHTSQLTFHVPGPPDSPHGVGFDSDPDGLGGTISWHAPAHDGFSPIVGYRVSDTTTDEVVCETAALSCRVDVDPGQTARFRVVAYNKWGESPASTAPYSFFSSAVDLPRYDIPAKQLMILPISFHPDAVTGAVTMDVRVTVTNGVLKLGSPGDASVTRHSDTSLVLSGAPEDVQAALGSLIWHTPDNTSVEQVAVSVLINDAMAGYRRVDMQMIPRVPDAPSDAQFTVGDDGESAEISWATPPHDGHSPIDGYVVVDEVANRIVCEVTPEVRTCTDDVPTGDTARYGVAASSAYGFGDVEWIPGRFFSGGVSAPTAHTLTGTTVDVPVSLLADFARADSPLQVRLSVTDGELQVADDAVAGHRSDAAMAGHRSEPDSLVLSGTASDVEGALASLRWAAPEEPGTYELVVRVIVDDDDGDRVAGVTRLLTATAPSTPPPAEPPTTQPSTPTTQAPSTQAPATQPSSTQPSSTQSPAGPATASRARAGRPTASGTPGADARYSDSRGQPGGAHPHTGTDPSAASALAVGLLAVGGALLLVSGRRHRRADVHHE